MRTFLNLSAAACILLGCTTVGLAQDNTAPRTLSPRNLNVERTEDVDSTDTSTPDTQQILSGGIAVQELGQVNQEALGVLSGSAAFPADMWQGSTRTLVDPLLERLPNQPATPYLRVLQRRLLLSAAQPPRGTDGERSLLELRASKLANMGQTRDVISLIRSAPKDERTPALDALLSDALLLEDQTSKACALAAQNIQTQTDPVWVKTMAFCRLLAKQNSQAMLSLSLLQDSGDNDPVYYKLMDALNNAERPKLDNLPAPKPLELALIRATRAILSDDIRNSDDPIVLSMLTRAGDINATQKAVERNLASADFLKEAFKREKFSDAQRKDPLKTAENLDPVKAKALLYQVAAEKDQLSVIRSEAIALAFELGAEQNLFFSLARLYRSMITGLPRGIDMLWFAPQALRSQLAAGEWKNAKAWYLLLRNAAFSDTEAAQQMMNLRPLAVLAGFDSAPAVVSRTMSDWWRIQESTPQSFEKAARLYSIADGLGLKTPQHLWITLMDGPRLPHGEVPKAGVWLKMNHAADNERLGETVLLMLNGFANTSTSDMDNTFLRDSIAALHKLGRGRDARILAVETLLQTGF